MDKANLGRAMAHAHAFDEAEKAQDKINKLEKRVSNLDGNKS